MSDPIIRVSSLSGWQDCPRRNAARTFNTLLAEQGYEFIERVNNVASSFGTGLHSGQELVLQGKIDGKIPSLDDMIEASCESFRTQTRDGVEYDNTTTSLDVADKQTANICRAWYYGVLPKVNPVMVEGEIIEPVPGGLVLSGHPDVVESDTIRDLKTGKSGNTYHAQLGGYSLLAKARGIAIPEWSVVDWIPRSTLKNEQPEPVEYRYPAALCEQEAQSALAELARQYKKYIKTQNPGVFVCNTMSRMCSSRYCEAYGTDWCLVSQTL